MKKRKILETLDCKLRKQADEKNQFDCATILNELDTASKNGEYGRTIQLKINQAHYIKTLGLRVESVPDKMGYYEISWKNEE